MRRGSPTNTLTFKPNIHKKPLKDAELVWTSGTTTGRAFSLIFRTVFHHKGGGGGGGGAGHSGFVHHKKDKFQKKERKKKKSHDL